MDSILRVFHSNTNSTVVCDIQLACYANDINKIKELLSHGYNVNHIDSIGRTPIQTACILNLKDIVELLLDNGANINHKDSLGRTCIHFMSHSKSDPQILKLLINRGVDIESRDYTNSSILDLCCLYGNNVGATILINSGAKVNCLGYNEMTPLCISCSQENYYLVNTLLKNGANVNYSNLTSSPLYSACKQNNSEIVRVLLENGANSNFNTTDVKNFIADYLEENFIVRKPKTNSH